MVRPLISVIVPVYKVEPYLEKCLDSIVGQTYRNLEILLVDDGSPDRCGAICDACAERDSRVRVIHQQNGGISAARNAAMEIARGQWLGFVDSDDWLEPDMYEVLLEAAMRTDADMAACGRWVEHPSHRKINCPEEERLLDREKAVELLLQDVVFQCTVWDKLVRRELYDGIRFPEGRNFEDLAVMYRVVERTERVCILPVPLYHYKQRPGSVMADRSLKNNLMQYQSSCERRQDMEPRWPQYSELLRTREMTSAVALWCGVYFASAAERRKYWPEILEISEQMRQLDPEICRKSMAVGRIGKLVFPLMRFPRWWSFAAAAMLWKIRLLYQRYWS